MPKTNTIQVRLTKIQKERAELNMSNSGHKTMSAFVRSLLLQGLAESKMIREIHQKIIEDDKK